MARNPHVPGNAEDMELIDAYLEHLRRAGKAQSTIDGRREILGRLDRDLPYGVGQVSEEDLKVWLYRDGWKPNTRFTYFSCMKDFYGWASDPEDPWITGNPMARLEAVRKPKGIARPCTDEQLGIILTQAREPFRTWALLAAYQGIRCVEISRLDREHVTERQLFVMRGKGGRPRVHDMDADVWAALKDLPPGAVARRPDGERASAFYVSSEAATYFRRTLKVPVSMHQLRHWLGVNVQRRHRDIRVTMAMLGHLSMQSTQIYTDATDEQQREARATLPRLAG